MQSWGVCVEKFVNDFANDKDVISNLDLLAHGALQCAQRSGDSGSVNARSAFSFVKPAKANLSF